MKQKSCTEPLGSPNADNEADGKDDESVRRDRIEKYKEERRLALRQRYQVDESLNDQKDEEMIRRIKQKILKIENGASDDLQGRLDFDSSPSEKNEQLLAKDISNKPPTAVTTISILYKSKRRQDKADTVPDANSVNEVQTAAEKRASSDETENYRPVDSTTLVSKSNTKDWSPKNAGCENRRPFTSSLERKVKSFVKQESLVAMRVNQLAEASESSDLTCRRNGEYGLV